jgi:hypothetical protein
MNQIQILRNNLYNEPGILTKLEKALSYIKPDVLYILPPVSELIKYVIIQIFAIENKIKSYSIIMFITYNPEMSIAVEKLPLPHRDVRKKS